MHFCSECGGLSKRLSQFTYTEGGVRYTRTRWKCLDCEEVDEVGRTERVDHQQVEDVGRGIVERAGEHPLDSRHS